MKQTKSRGKPSDYVMQRLSQTPGLDVYNRMGVITLLRSTNCTDGLPIYITAKLKGKLDLKCMFHQMHYDNRQELNDSILTLNRIAKFYSTSESLFEPIKMVISINRVMNKVNLIMRREVVDLDFINDPVKYITTFEKTADKLKNEILNSYNTADKENYWLKEEMVNWVR